jgi:hypothetical protein
MVPFETGILDMTRRSFAVAGACAVIVVVGVGSKRCVTYSFLDASTGQQLMMTQQR